VGERDDRTGFQSTPKGRQSDSNRYAKLTDSKQLAPKSSIVKGSCAPIGCNVRTVLLYRRVRKH
jgi:hypothetical protein